MLSVVEHRFHTCQALQKRRHQSLSSNYRDLDGMGTLRAEKRERPLPKSSQQHQQQHHADNETYLVHSSNVESTIVTMMAKEPEEVVNARKEKTLPCT